MYGYPCEYCSGTVRAKTVEREAFKHARGFVILEQVTIGLCNRCGNRYCGADVLRLVDTIATGRLAPEGLESIPVARAGSDGELNSSFPTREDQRGGRRAIRLRPPRKCLPPQGFAYLQAPSVVYAAGKCLNSIETSCRSA